MTDWKVLSSVEAAISGLITLVLAVMIKLVAVIFVRCVSSQFKENCFSLLVTNGCGRNLHVVNSQYYSYWCSVCKPV